MAGKAVTKAKKSEVQEFDPGMFEADAGSGNENMTQDDLALPFLKILSGLDPLLDDDNFDGRKGDIYNTVTGDVYKGKDGIRVLPCAYQRRFIEWAPRGVGSGAPVNIFAPEEKRPQTERSKDDNREYVVGGSGTYIEETHQHFVLVIDEDGGAQPALIAMKSTQLKKSRKWNSMIQGRTLMGKNGPFQAPRFSHVYVLRSVSEENSKGSWHGWDMGLEGVVEDYALYGQGKAFAASIGSGDVQVKHSQDGDDPKSDEIPF
tara:strand:- start:447 stop:1229 length:783 start_codon:yes stop_codon:yes gene_type:complete